MGYCYENGKLVCDSCGITGKVRKVPCPYGYCPPPALCPACRKKYPNTKASHSQCKVLSDQFHAELAKRQQLLAEGKYLRIAALAVFEKVHVLFRNQQKHTIGKYMSHQSYDSIPLGVAATVEDYAAKGELQDAPDDFEFVHCNN